MNIHFVGIGGIGISALAQFCYQRGDSISGSNLGTNRIFEMLLSEGITSLYEVHDACNLPQNFDLLIYSEAISTDNPERIEAKKRDIREKSYFEFLGDISHEFTTIAVAGTHGKTTTTGLITSGFQKVDFDATVFVGSTLDILKGKNFHQGSNNFLLLEACEYRENFKFLDPDILLITNIEHDHADYFKDEASYFAAFKKLAKRSKNIIFHEADQVTWDLVEHLPAKKFPIPKQSDNSWEAILKIFGEANQQNATLALGLAHKLEVDLDKFKEGLGNYKGAGRRQEFLGSITLSLLGRAGGGVNLNNTPPNLPFKGRNILVYDDYGHHPTEIRATLEAFRSKFPGKKIGLIFEPHQYSRTRQFFEAFAESFRLADFAGLFPIYEARDTEEDKKSVSIDDFITDNPNVIKIKKLQDVESFVENLDNGDILLFMGAGKVSDFAHEFMRK